MRFSFRGFLSEFKAFAFKGNMIDLAVAVVIGAAFGTVITSLVNDIIMPAVSYVTSAASSTVDAATDAAKKASQAAGLTTTQPSTTQPSTTQSSATQPSATQPSATQPATTAPAATQAPPAPPAAPAAPPPAQTPPAQRSPTQAVDFSWHIGRFAVGHFIAALLNFMIVAFAVFLTMVKLLGSVAKRVGKTPDPSEPVTKECPLCLSIIPIKATRCAHCAADLPRSPQAPG